MRRFVPVKRAGREGKARCHRHLQFDRDKDHPVSLNLSGIREKTWLIAVDCVRLVARGGQGMAIRIGEVKSSSLSDDKKEVIVGGAGKYIGDVELRFARECLDDLMEGLIRAKDALAPSAGAAPVPNPPAVAAAKRNGGAGA